MRVVPHLLLPGQLLVRPLGIFPRSNHPSSAVNMTPTVGRRSHSARVPGGDLIIRNLFSAQRPRRLKPDEIPGPPALPAGADARFRRDVPF